MARLPWEGKKTETAMEKERKLVRGKEVIRGRRGSLTASLLQGTAVIQRMCPEGTCRKRVLWGKGRDRKLSQEKGLSTPLTSDGTY